MSKYFPIVQDILVKHFCIEKPIIIPTSKLNNDLGLDSLDIVDLSVRLEDEFHISNITIDDSDGFKTVLDITAYLDKRLGV